jgi:hypothetical protein
MTFLNAKMLMHGKTPAAGRNAPSTRLRTRMLD